MTPLDRTERAPRRIVAIDFDWHDADLLPGLLRTPGLHVGLVAGAGDDDAGVRVAALCGLPHSTELADLTREIFDAALVGERSPRREQLDRLLRALGTPVASPAGFVHAADEPAAPPDAVAAAEPAAPEAAAEPPRPAVAAAPIEIVAAAADDAPGLARTLAAGCAATHALAAVLADATAPAMLARHGGGDPLLEALVALAARLDAPVVVTREDGADAGRLWGAWPFAGGGRRAVLAVAGAAGATARYAWEAAADALRAAWDAAAAPAVVDAAAFSHRLAAAAGQRRAHGEPFTLRRLAFDGPDEVVDRALAAVTGALPAAGGVDCACRTAPGELLLLCAGTDDRYGRSRDAIETLWRDAWPRAGGPGAAPRLVEEALELEPGVDDDARSLTPDRVRV